MQNKVRSIRLPHFKLYYKTVGVTIAGYCHKKRNTNQWSSIESPERNPCLYDQLILTKKSRFNEKVLFNKLRTLYSHKQKNIPGSLSYTMYKTKLK